MTSAVARPARGRPQPELAADPLARRIALAAGAIFIVAGLVKFVFHSWELAHFREFGLPWPALLEILAGVFETIGGLLLVLRLLIAPVALLLAITMVVAIAYSGIGNGDVIPSCRYREGWCAR